MDEEISYREFLKGLQEISKEKDLISTSFIPKSLNRIYEELTFDFPLLNHLDLKRFKEDIASHIYHPQCLEKFPYCLKKSFFDGIIYGARFI